MTTIDIVFKVFVLVMVLYFDFALLALTSVLRINNEKMDGKRK